MILCMGLSHSGRVLNEPVSSHHFSHHVWQNVLAEFVSETGQVNFNAIRARPRQLNQYLDQLSAISPDSHPERFKGNNHRLAYWINAYNALALRTLLNHYPVTRLDDIPGGLPAFRNKPRYALGGALLSLQALEEKIATEFYWKAPAFFALSDLSRTSPRLWNQAYQGDVLDEQLEGRVAAFIDNSQNVTVQSYCTPIILNPVFKQFQRPLTRYVREELQLKEGEIMDFIQPYTAPLVRGYLSRKCSREIIYRPFDNRL